MSEDSGPSNIQVICRFRPINEREHLNCADKKCVEFKDNQTVTITPVAENNGPHTFTLDHVFPPDSSQKEVYEKAAKPTVEAVMQGFNGTVFAYGQTSSGKTFTMTGPDMSDSEMMGIIPRMVSTVFGQIESCDSKTEFQVKVGYCEIYLEKIKDLLDTNKVNLKVHEDRTRGVYIADLTEEYVSSGGEVHQLMRYGTSNREVGSTQMNAGSSRSHSIFILTVTQSSLSDFSSKTGKLYLVDLAGSEKVGKTGAEGRRLEEAKNINKSLTMLGNVITALTDGKSSHIPYRDSKLTRVLQDSLGGNSKTALIVTCSPSPYNDSETISTLRFGIRAKSIKNKPKVNREYTINELKLMLAQAKEELVKKDRIIAALKKSLNSSGVVLPNDEKLAIDPLEEAEEAEELKDSIQNSDLYAQVIMELEDLQKKLYDSETLNKKYKSLIEDLQEDNSQIRQDHNFIYKQIKDLQDKLIQTEETVAQQAIEIESLKSELTIEVDKKFKVESQLLEKSSQLNDLSTNLLKNLKDEKKRVCELLEEEKVKNAELRTEMGKMTQELKQNMNMNEDKKLNILEHNYQFENERWAREKKSLTHQVMDGVDKVISLQMQLEDAATAYNNLESSLSEGERNYKKKYDNLHRNLEQLNLMYHQLVSQQSSLKVNKAIAEKKAARLVDKLALNEKAFKEEVEKRLKYEGEIEGLKAMIEELELVNKQLVAASNFSGKNIRKVIRGGGDFLYKTGSSRRTNSTIPESSLREETEDE